MPNARFPFESHNAAPIQLGSMIRLFRVFIPTTILLLLVSEVLLIAGIYLASMYWQFQEIWLYLQLEDGWAQVALVTATIILGLYLNDCYERLRMQSQMIFVQQLCLVIGVAFLIQALFSYGRLTVRMPRQAMLLGSFVCLIVLPLWRSIYSKLALQLIGAESVLLVGTHPLQFALLHHLKDRPECAMRPFGVVAENKDTAERCLPSYLLGTMDDLDQILATYQPHRIIVGLADYADRSILPKVFGLLNTGRRVEATNQIYETLLGRVPLSQFTQQQIYPTEAFRPSMIHSLQTVYGWVIAAVGLVVLSPVMLAAALAVRLTSPGPVLFRQTRAGQNNVPFLLYKFRSMYVDAEKFTGAVWATENDPRVTPLGRVLRKYRIDELPQLFNVLRGEMSIVGPRPERPEFLKKLSDEIPFFMHRLAVKPGITGWAQINYKYGNTTEDSVIKLEYDLYYIKHFSPQLDFYIMFHTVKTMLLTRGAY
jgi:exopolysaccharide biosynthesis polyprenyl glycosylphosphotransferase